MFVLHCIGILLAAPLVWLGQLLGLVSVPAARLLYTMAWHLSGDGEIGCLALTATARVYGEVAALAEAEHWLQRRADPAIAAHGGLLALQNGQLDLARQLLDEGKQAGRDRGGMLELLEWLLTTGTGDGQAVQDLARQWEPRRDLQPLLSRQVLITLMWEALQDHRFEEAGRRAMHLLSIEDVPQAEMALWALAKRDGDVQGAEAHLRRANLEPRHRLSFQILGNVAIGFNEEARALQAQLHKLDPAQAALAGQALGSRQEEPA